MNNFEGGYFEFYKQKGLDYAEDFHFCNSEKSRISPRFLKDRYRFDDDSLSGEGKTIGIVCAYGYDDIQNDLDLFCEKFGILSSKVDIYRAKSFVGAKRSVKKSWATECALDLQWVHAFAPKAFKKCYICGSDDLNDIFETLSLADNECDIICLCFGKQEFAGVSEYEKFFEKAKAFYICASGNNGKVNYPACSQYVLAVGGTKVYFFPDGDMLGSETLYEKSGCGLSKYCNIPEFQAKNESMRRLSAYRRSVPDLCFFADGNMGYPVFVNGNIECCAGTSASASCVSGICAALSEFDGKILTKKASYFYELAEKGAIFKRPSPFFDITSGASGDYCAGVGIDIPTGLGAPNFEEIKRAASMLF